MVTQLDLFCKWANEQYEKRDLNFALNSIQMRVAAEVTSNTLVMVKEKRQAGISTVFVMLARFLGSQGQNVVFITANSLTKNNHIVLLNQFPETARAVNFNTIDKIQIFGTDADFIFIDDMEMCDPAALNTFFDITYPTLRRSKTLPLYVSGRPIPGITKFQKMWEALKTEIN